jgi:O-methyltransferase involved in polyketide biosynthesis
VAVAQLDLNIRVPHVARVYDYILGGKDNFESDRKAAEAMLEASPSIASSMRANRDFMVRMARYLAAERGIRQFLDIGAGLPTSPNLHQVVQGVAPECRVVYVDNDPIVLVHARALLTSSPEGRTGYLNADLHDAEAILTAPEVAKVLDLSAPVGLCLIAVLHMVADDQEAQRIVDQLVARLAPGSVLAVSTLTNENTPEDGARGETASNANGIPVKSRTRSEVERWFAGLDLIEPGVVLVNRWHPDEAAAGVDDSLVHMYGAAGVKP